MPRSIDNLKLNYIKSLYAEEDEILVNTRMSIQDEKLISIQISPTEGKIIHTLLKMINAKYVLEIGALAGYSTIWIARALDLGGFLISIEKNIDNYILCKKNIAKSDVVNKICMLHGSGSDQDVWKDVKEKMHNKLLDAVFIDGAKAEYIKYLDLALPYLRKGGLIIADNTMLLDRVWNIDDKNYNSKSAIAMREFNKKIADKSKFTSVILPIYDGLSVSVNVGV